MAEIQGHGVRAIWAFRKVSKLDSGGRGVGGWEQPLGCSMMNQSRRLRELWGKGGAQGEWPLCGGLFGGQLIILLFWGGKLQYTLAYSHALMTPNSLSKTVKKLPPG